MKTITELNEDIEELNQAMFDVVNNENSFRNKKLHKEAKAEILRIARKIKELKSEVQNIERAHNLKAKFVKSLSSKQKKLYLQAFDAELKADS